MIIIRKVNFFKEITCKNKKIMVIFISVADRSDKKEFGSMVKRLRHRPFTAVTRVRFPLESLAVKLIQSAEHYADVAQLAEQLICNQQVIGSSPIIGFVPERDI